MKKSRFIEEQIVFALKQAELGTLAPEVCRKLGIADWSAFCLDLRASTDCFAVIGQRAWGVGEVAVGKEWVCAVGFRRNLQ